MKDVEREQHLIDVYKVIKRTISSPSGPCSTMTEYLITKCKAEVEDLTHEVFADYLTSYKPGKYDPAKSALNTYINKFIRWRLSRYIRDTKADKRLINYEADSYDYLKEQLGEVPVSQELRIDYSGYDYMLEKYADLIESLKKNGRITEQK